MIGRLHALGCLGGFAGGPLSLLRSVFGCLCRTQRFSHSFVVGGAKLFGPVGGKARSGLSLLDSFAD